MASFLLNFLPFPFNPQFENVSLAVQLDRWNFARLSLRHVAIRIKNFPLRPAR